MNINVHLQFYDNLFCKFEAFNLLATVNFAFRLCILKIFPLTIVSPTHLYSPVSGEYFFFLKTGLKYNDP